MMTLFEAHDRAKLIWGDADLIGVERASPSESGKWWVNLRSDTRGHMLDGNGHTVCHPECAAKEDGVGS